MQQGGAPATAGAVTLNPAGQAIVRMPLPAEGPFFVRIAASVAAPDSIIACGDLVPPDVGRP